MTDIIQGILQKFIENSGRQKSVKHEIQLVKTKILSIAKEYLSGDSVKTYDESYRSAPSTLF